MNFFNQKKVKHLAGAFLATSALSIPTFIQAQTLTSNQTGTHNGFYYTFWKDTGNVSFGLHEGGRYTSQWDNSINNWVGGKGWNPGGAKVVNYSGTYNIDSSQNSYLALYGWTKSPLVEYYVIESYGSYNPSSCSGGQDFGSFQSDGATYNIRRCQRVNQPSIEGTSTFYQYFSVRTPKKGFGNISGTITVANHFNAWASAGLNLGSHDYMVLATEGYQSSGSSDITVSEGAGGTTTGGGGTPTTTNTSSASSSDIIVRARGTAGGEHINLIIGDSVVADWTITTSFANYSYSGNVAGDIAVEFDNDGGDRDVILDYVFVNGETRQAEDMEYNTATYDGECGGGSYSETMHCGGMIGFGDTGDCFSGNCNASNSPTSSTSNSGSTSATSSNTSTTTQNNTSCSGYVGITFDDGPMSSTSNLINTLKQNNLTPVTWFNTGQNASSNSYMMAQQLSVGEVQNHSYSHPHMSGYSYSQVYDELNRANQAIQSAGAPKPTLYRPPYGETNSTIEQAASALGLRVITWDVDSQDWNGASASAIANAASQLQNGQVILMHDGQANTATAIAQIASGLRSRGLCPGRIDPSSGRAVAPSNTTTSNTATNTNTNTGSQQNSTSGSNQISVVAKGVNGDESITLSVGGTSVQTWTLSTGYQTYSASTNASGDIEVEFTNDADGRDVQIDYITINGETRQAEDMEYNTGAYDGECGGGSYSEMLHCSGAIGFGGTSDNFGGSTNTSTTSAPTTTVTPTAVTTNTSGQCQCNWYGSSYAVCGNQSSGWGWENNASCIGTDTCNGQSGSGGVVCN